jgi:hypothetical protein
MKSFMILGAVVGFALGAGSSLAGGCMGSTMFWHASVTALVGGVLARWWGQIWFTGLAEALEQQRRARAQAAAESKKTTKL